MAERQTALPPFAVTMGEPAGIGCEIAVKAWAQRRQRNLPAFFIIGDPELIGRAATAAGVDAPVMEIADAARATACPKDVLPVLPVYLPAPATPGRLDPANAPAVIEAIARAVSLAQRGEVAAIVTNPIQKSTLLKAGFNYPGHTEYLAELCGSQTAPVMMLAGPDLRTVPVTVHLSLAQAIAQLSTDLIVTQSVTTANALKRDFGCVAPCLAVAALNPHAGENSALGTEEEKIIAPAVARLRDMGISVIGPLPADTMFHAAARKEYDAAICMYHDQALIPLKTLNFDAGVNITLGLPIVRTSPDHGTALSLAGTGKASDESFIYALKTAAELAERRAQSASADA